MICRNRVALVLFAHFGLVAGGWRSASERSVHWVCLRLLFILMSVKNIVIGMFFCKDLRVFVKHSFVVFVFRHLFEKGNVVLDSRLHVHQISWRFLLRFSAFVTVVEASLGCACLSWLL